MSDMEASVRSLLNDLARNAAPHRRSLDSVVRRSRRRLGLALLTGVVSVAAVVVVGSSVLNGLASDSINPVAPGPTSSQIAASGEIAFLSKRGRGPGLSIYRLELEDRRITRIGPQYIWSSRLAWSPDGSYLAFDQGISEGHGAIKIIDVASGDVDRLPIDPLLSPNYPTWSPDGRRLAFSSDSGDLYTIDSDGSNLVRLTDAALETPGTDDFDPSSGVAWSPDGSLLAFDCSCANDGVGGSAIYVASPDGSGRRQVSRIYGRLPSWSPDGDRIAFAGRDGIYSIAADGTSLLRLTTGVDDSDPSWSPGGGLIAFSRDKDIVVMNEDGSNETTLIHHRSWDAAPAWRPSEAD